MGIKFDSNLGESFATTLGKDVLPDLEKHNILVTSQGAQVVYMKRDSDHHTGWRPLTKDQTGEYEEGKDQVVIIQKSDDSSVYALRDLGLCKFRSQVMGIEYMVYVVGSEQSSYFQQVICLAEYMGYVKPQAMKHLGYGLYLQDGKKMSSRKGGVFRTIELIDEIANAIEAQFENSNHEQAQKLAISALIINDTKGDISKDVNLDIPTMTKINGDTGVYIQYTAVRMRSLMQKLNEEKITDFSNIKLKTESLSDLQKKILFESSLLPLKIRTSLELLKPHIITQYLLNLSALLNRWYNDSPKAVEMKDEERKQNLLRLHSVLIILEKTLNILHMPRVEKM